jgi:hypothetical protein
MTAAASAEQNQTTANPGGFMGKGKAITKIAAIGAAIAGAIFFWRKRQHHEDSATGGGFPPAADVPPDRTP